MILDPISSTPGCYYATHPLFPPARCRRALHLAQTFFALPQPAKEALAIENSPHFRGYSHLRNDRDWREQIHFSREEPAEGSHPPYNQLRGPNLMPADLQWRGSILSLLHDLELAARDILEAITQSLGLAPHSLLPFAASPYLLLKLIHYPVSPDPTPRSGVAPHVDFSLITLLIQDDTGGLDICEPNGDWVPVYPRPGALFVNTGEILQFQTQGRLPATPHRVVNRSTTRARLSLPFFLNPALTQIIAPQLPPSRATPDQEHIHRVLHPAAATPFLFGDAEWQRKGQGVWCAACVQP